MRITTWYRISKTMHMRYHDVVRISKTMHMRYHDVGPHIDYDVYADHVVVPHIDDDAYAVLDVGPHIDYDVYAVLDVRPHIEDGSYAGPDSSIYSFNGSRHIRLDVLPSTTIKHDNIPRPIHTVCDKTQHNATQRNTSGQLTATRQRNITKLKSPNAVSRLSTHDLNPLTRSRSNSQPAGSPFDPQTRWASRTAHACAETRSSGNSKPHRGSGWHDRRQERETASWMDEGSDPPRLKGTTRRTT
jgi:hypothetical protein